MTRIVAGIARGRRIEVPARGTRPTSDRVREAMFSALESAVDLSGARVLDLYGGSGALGLEALSRGAAHVTFIESDRRAAQLLRRNATTLGFHSLHVHQAKAETTLATTADEAYDLVFADPPYDLDEARLEQVLTALAVNGWTGEESLLILERAVRSGTPDWPHGWEALRVRRYGDTALHWAIRRERATADGGW